jgi:hypothetical protein
MQPPASPWTERLSRVCLTATLAVPGDNQLDRGCSPLKQQQAGMGSQLAASLRHTRPRKDFIAVKVPDKKQPEAQR